MQKLIIASLVGFSLFYAINNASANINIILDHRLLGDNYCSSLGGSTWRGTGKASGIVSCQYSGQGTVTSGPSGLNFEVNFDKTGGSFLCPSHENQQLALTCDDSGLHVKNDQVDLSGQFTDANDITLSGTLKAMGVTDQLTIAMQKIAF